MNLVQINNEISREKACIDDLIKLMSMHTHAGRLEEAARLGRDMQNSISYIQKLEKQKQLYQMALKFNGKVVKRYAN